MAWHQWHIVFQDRIKSLFNCFFFLIILIRMHARLQRNININSSGQLLCKYHFLCFFTADGLLETLVIISQVKTASHSPNVCLISRPSVFSGHFATQPICTWNRSVVWSTWSTLMYYSSINYTANYRRGFLTSVI